MTQRIPLLVGAVVAVVSLTAHCQQFPEDALTPKAADIKKYLDDKVFGVKLSDGNSWRLQYNANEYIFVNTSQGAKVSGQWDTENGRLCTQMQGEKRGCNDVRFFHDTLHLKRINGEIIKLAAQ